MMILTSQMYDHLTPIPVFWRQDIQEASHWGLAKGFHNFPACQLWYVVGQAYAQLRERKFRGRILDDRHQKQSSHLKRQHRHCRSQGVASRRCSLLACLDSEDCATTIPL